jgi:hypothetical protein
LAAVTARRRVVVADVTAAEAALAERTGASVTAVVAVQVATAEVASLEVAVATAAERRWTVAELATWQVELGAARAAACIHKL